MEQRLQKILSQCGITSRRKAEEMILQGEVTVNGQIAVIGMKADPERDHIKVRGKILKTLHSKVYLLFNKPERCITSLYDPEKRPTIMDYLRDIKSRVYPVGRLDYNSEGLILLTNDGELAHAILHPARKIPKTYLVKIDGVLEDKDISQLKKGIKLEDGITAPARIEKVRKMKTNSWVEITIYEGKKRQVRRMFERLGHPVIRLKRTRLLKK
jgi:23S rRNA pseudouridine2605 synthase